MLELSGNISMSFGAQYKAEDTAAYILYGFDRQTLSSRAVAGERFARYAGLAVHSALLFPDGAWQGLSLVAFEPQCVYTLDGQRLYLSAPAVVAEKSIALGGDYKLYNYALILGAAQYLVGCAGRNRQEPQMSFGLSQTVSLRNEYLGLRDLYGTYEREKLLPADNFAMCLAMPKNRFKTEVNRLLGELNIRRTDITGGNVSFLTRQLSDAFTVPQLMTLVRLRQLNCL